MDPLAAEGAHLANRWLGPQHSMELNWDSFRALQAQELFLITDLIVQVLKLFSFDSQPSARTTGNEENSFPLLPHLSLSPFPSLEHLIGLKL